MIKELTNKYLSGTTSADEERELLRMLEAIPNPSAEEKALAAMLKVSPITSSSAWMEEDESPLYDAMIRDRKGVSPLHRILPWIGIAAVMVIVLGTAFSLNRDRHQEAVAYVYGREVKDESEVLGMMESTMETFMEEAESDKVEAQLTEIFGK